MILIDVYIGLTAIGAITFWALAVTGRDRRPTGTFRPTEQAARRAA